MKTKTYSIAHPILYRHRGRGPSWFWYYFIEGQWYSEELTYACQTEQPEMWGMMGFLGENKWRVG